MFYLIHYNCIFLDNVLYYLIQRKCIKINGEWGYNLDKNMEFHAHTQTLIGNQKRTLIDKDTGEIVHVDQITKRVYGTKNFWKMYLMDFLGILGIIDNKQLEVFIYIAENTEPSNNLFIGTYRSISKDVEVAYGTVSTIMKKLQDNNFIKKLQNGVYQVNPNIMMKGNDTKRQILLSYYEEEQPFNSVEILRGKQKAISEQSSIVERVQFNPVIENRGGKSD